MNDLQKLTYTVDEMGAVLGISRVTAFNLVKTPGFPSIRVGKRILVPKDALNKWINSKSASGTVGA